MHQSTYKHNQITPALSYVHPQYINIMNYEDSSQHSQKLPVAPSNCNPVQFNASSAPSHTRAPSLEGPKFDGVKKVLDQLRTCSDGSHLISSVKMMLLNPTTCCMYRQWSLYVPPVATMCTAGGHYMYRQ